MIKLFLLAFLQLVVLAAARANSVKPGRVRPFHSALVKTATASASMSRTGTNLFHGLQENKRFSKGENRRSRGKNANFSTSTTDFLPYPRAGSTSPINPLSRATGEASTSFQCSSANALYFPSTIVGIKADRVEDNLPEKFSNIRGSSQVALGAVILVPALVHRVSFLTSPNSSLSIALGEQSPLVLMTTNGTQNSSEMIILEPEVFTTFVGLEVKCDEGAEAFIEHLYIDVNPDVCCGMDVPIADSFSTAASITDAEPHPFSRKSPSTPSSYFSSTSSSSSPSQPVEMCKVGQKCVNLSVSEIVCVDI